MEQQKQTIQLLWWRNEQSHSFNGTLIGYKNLETGINGSFSSKRLPSYKSIFNIIDNNDILKQIQ